MSELIQKNDNRATIRWKLLTGASALALTAYVASAGMANADDADRPTVWIEFGGQMEQLQGMNAPFTAPFMSLTPTPDVYKGMSFTGSQDQARFSFGEEAAITFQPEDSTWNFSAGIRYGRSHSKRHRHQEQLVGSHHFSFSTHATYFYPSTSYTRTTAFGPYSGTVKPSAHKLADTNTRSKEQHLILDFTAGKDVGLGLFGRSGSSTLNVGVRFASFTTRTQAYITARPSVNIKTEIFSSTRHYPSATIRLTAPEYFATFHQFLMSASARRSFKGVGPTLSWNASAAIAGNEESTELVLDWGINAALLFGKQKAKTAHWTKEYYHISQRSGYPMVYPTRTHHSTRSRSVAVPNIGGFASLSLKWTNAKISFGYRYDTFLNAMDVGIDAAKKSNVTFNGPYASISFGLGD